MKQDRLQINHSGYEKFDGVKKQREINCAGYSISMNGNRVAWKSECSRMTFGVPPVLHISILYVVYRSISDMRSISQVMRINAVCKQYSDETIAQEGVN